MPHNDHSRQFTVAARVNGNGIDAALLVSSTVRSAARGDANMIKQNTTPLAPTHRTASSIGQAKATRSVTPTTVAHPNTCCCKVPGRVGLRFGAWGKNMETYNNARINPTMLLYIIFFSFLKMPYVVHWGVTTIDKW